MVFVRIEDEFHVQARTVALRVQMTQLVLSRLASEMSLQRHCSAADEFEVTVKRFHWHSI